LALAERANDSGTCWPSLTHLSEMTGLARSTVALALRGLEETGLIVRERSGAGKSTRYRLLTETAGVASDVDPPVAADDAGCSRKDVRRSDSGSPSAGPPAGSRDGRVRQSVVRETDQGGSRDGPSRPAAELAIVRETDPNRHKNRHRTESEPSLCGDDTAPPEKSRAHDSRKGTLIPPDWRPGERVFDWAAKRGMNRTWVETQIEEFLVYWSDTGERRKSWDATFINRLQALQANQPRDQAREPEPRLADKDYLTGATPLDQIPWLDPATFR